ncbi:hypothetical protein ABPG75_013002 [Micractinium tetrahymenae]
MAGSTLRRQLAELLGGAEEALAEASGSKKKSPSDFCCAGPLSRTGPGLEVDGMGAVRLPLDAEHEAALAARMQPAPYGKGEQTLVDPAVRKTLQLDPSHFHLTNPRFQGQVVDEALRRAKATLGVDEDTEVEAQLYKLLLYREGSFFKPHRDSEKAPGMFATLAIQLPSRHTGGELVVQHAGRSLTVDLAARNASASCCAAFYADCEHEVKPVTSGARLVLVYNLVHKGAGPAPPKLAEGSPAVAKLVQLAHGWGADSTGLMRLCWVFDHSYSEESLRERGMAALKGRDRAAAQLRLAACQAGAELDASLALVTRICSEAGEMGEDEFGEFGFGSGAQKGFNWGEIRANKWSVLAGPAPAFSSVQLAPGELLQGEDFWEGMGQTRWYRRAGLLLYPASQRLANAVAYEPTRAVLRLFDMLNPGVAELPSDDPVASALAALRKRQRALERVQPGGAAASGGDSAQDVDQEDEELGLFGMFGDAEGYSSGDYEMGMQVRMEKQEREDREARRHWGPEPEATPVQLAQEVVKHLFLSNRLSYYREEAQLMLQLAAQLGHAGVASVLLQAVLHKLARPSLPEPHAALACAWP